MPQEPIIIDTTIVATGIRARSYGNVGIIGVDSGGSAADNEVKIIDNLSEVGTQFGITSDIYKAAAKVFAQKVQKVWCIRATKTPVSAESITMGSLQTLANHPVAGRDDVVIAATTITYIYITPTDPGVSKAEVNTKTGEIFVSGTGSAAVDYSYVDWDAAISKLKDYNIQLLIPANAPADEHFYGDLDALYTHMDTYKWCGVFMSKSGKTAAEIVTDLGKYSSMHVVGLGHKHSDDTIDFAAAVCGVLSITQNWDKLMWKKVFSAIPDGFFTRTEVEDTLEAGKVSAMIKKSDYYVPSDGLTTVGGDYKYIDITRTRYYVEDLINDALTGAIMNTRIPYEQSGIEYIRSVIERACETAVLVGALRAPWIDTDGSLKRGYEVEVPVFADVPAADREARLLQNVFVTMWLAGHIQSIKINLSIQI